MNQEVMHILHLLEFTDSTFPVGTFSFSNGLETAAHEGIIKDAASLEQYVRSCAVQSAYTDGIVALGAYYATKKEDYSEILRADQEAILCRMNAEARLMLCRMGKKMAELMTHIHLEPLMVRWLGDIGKDITPGTFPVAQGITFATSGLSPKDLFCSQQYGVMNMILSAALRCVRVSHFDTQKILYHLAADSDRIYEDVRNLTYEDMNAFVPEADIFASMHEKGTMRMFMN